MFCLYGMGQTVDCIKKKVYEAKGVKNGAKFHLFIIFIYSSDLQDNFESLKFRATVKRSPL